MSKTVDELLEVFRNAGIDCSLENPDATGDDAERAGIAAIVRAMRDECDPDKFPRAGYMCWGDFNEILGPAGDEVADTPDLPTRTVQLTGITKSARPDVQFEPATAPAPAVCEWTKRGRNEPGFYNTPHGLCHINHLPKSGGCWCGNPIAFTEEK